MSDDNEDQLFPKPQRKKKEAKGLQRGGPLKRTPMKRKIPSRPKFTTEQQKKRRAFEQTYRKVVRPKYLLDLARAQGRLTTPDDDLPGDTPQEKLALLPAGQQPLCEVDGVNLATQIHHKRGRQRRKDAPHLLLDTTYFMGVSPSAHEFIENNRALAYEKGWLIPRNQVDEEV